jgi:dihydropteroate synthase
VTAPEECVAVANVEPLARTYRSPVLELRGRRFAWGERTFVMAVVNITPDSFSGDGTGGDVATAVSLARSAESEGADILDLGAESSRPGAAELDPAEEIRRLLPSLRAVRAETVLPISVDTYHALTAEAALDAGADLVNDIHGLRRDPAMAPLLARRGVAAVAMHNQRGQPDLGLVPGLAAGFDAILACATAAGLDPARLILDPGFGFGWRPEENLEMVRRLPDLWRFELPLLIGLSRKSTIGLVLDAAAGERLHGTSALVALAVAGGIDVVRVHDVAPLVQVTRVADAVVRARWRPPEA